MAAGKLVRSSLALSTVPNASSSRDQLQLAPATARFFCAPPALKTLHSLVSVRVSIGKDNLGGAHKETNHQTTKPHAVDRRPLCKTDLSRSVRGGGRIRVAYQGVSGAYSEAAAAKAYPNCETVPCEQFDVAFEAVENWVVDRAVLPIENSLGGSIHRNYDLLLRHRLHIVGEVQFAVQHCLLANHGVRLEDLTRVLSHQQALAQCENTLTKLGVVREAAHDTAGAAQFVALHKLKDTGAVASIAAAKIYDLAVLAQDIQDCSDNITRFLMLAREPVIPGTDRPFKTSIVFSLEEGPGMLYKALAVFSMRNINLTKIESRPLRKHSLPQPAENSTDSQKCFDYLFYCDFEASMADHNSQNALKHLKEFATFLRVLGSYPMDVNLTLKPSHCLLYLAAFCFVVSGCNLQIKTLFQG